LKLQISLSFDQTEQQKDLIEELTGWLLENAQLTLKYRLRFPDIEDMVHRLSIVRRLAEGGAITSIDTEEAQRYLFWVDTMKEELETIRNMFQD